MRKSDRSYPRAVYLRTNVWEEFVWDDLRIDIEDDLGIDLSKPSLITEEEAWEIKVYLENNYFKILRLKFGVRDDEPIAGILIYNSQKQTYKDITDWHRFARAVFQTLGLYERFDYFFKIGDFILSPEKEEEIRERVKKKQEEAEKRSKIKRLKRLL
jgi:hypothetical protein